MDGFAACYLTIVEGDRMIAIDGIILACICIVFLFVVGVGTLRGAGRMVLRGEEAG